MIVTMSMSLGVPAVVMLLEMDLLTRCLKVVCQTLREVLLRSPLETNWSFLTRELTPAVMLLHLGGYQIV